MILEDLKSKFGKEKKDIELAYRQIDDLPKGSTFDDAKRINNIFKKSQYTWSQVIEAFEAHRNEAKLQYMDIKDIHITQPNIQANKVKRMVDNFDKLDPINVVHFKNGEYAIYDGHHRLSAAWALGKKKIKINLIHLNLKESVLKLESDLLGVSKPYEIQVGDMVRNINTSCTHYKSVGTVLYVHDDGDITYQVDNKGATYTPGDELTKSQDQLMKVFTHTPRPGYGSFSNE